MTNITVYVPQILESPIGTLTPNDINNFGQIVGNGYSGTPSNAFAFFYNNGAASIISATDAWGTVQQPVGARAINDSGAIIGSIDFYSAFEIAGGTFYRLPGFGADSFNGGGALSGINNAGTIVGADHFQGQIYHLGDEAPTKFSIPGAAATIVEAINNNGHMVVFDNSNGTSNQSLDIAGNFAAFDIPGIPTNEVSITDINDLDQILGVYSDAASHSFIYDYNSDSVSIIALPTEFNASHIVANGINNDGTIVGTYYDEGASTYLPFVAQPATMNLFDGTGGNDVLVGTSGRDVIYGFDGDDTLNGRGGSDFLSGGSGADLYVYTTGAITITDFSPGEGDKIDVTGVAGIHSWTDLMAHFIAENAGIGLFDFGNGNLLRLESFSYPLSPSYFVLDHPPTDIALSASSVTENSGNGTLVGALSATDSDTGDAFTFSLLDDASGLFAINGNNLVVAGALDYEAATSHNITVRVTDSGGAYFDKAFAIQITNVPGVTITGNSSANLIDATHTIAGQPLPTGEEDSVNGGSGNDTIKSLGGNDTIDGGAGSDSLIGGTGNDTYIVDATGDKVLENPAEGTDRIQSSVTYTLPSNVEALILTGIANLNGTGNSGDNSVTGNSGNNILAGLGGADALDGGSGIDTATYVASLLGVDVSLATGIGSGGDAAGDSLINIENLTGSNFNDTLEGDGGDNVLTGGNGTDTLSYQHAGAGVTVNLSITSAQNTIGAGADTVTKFENLTGSAFDDSLTGSTANNVLMGLGGNDTLSDSGGNDTLDGGTGADSMAGGGGNDVYVVDDAGDVVTESSGGGTDTIQTTLNVYSLASIANLENLTFIGAGAFTGTGNGLNNALTGGSGNDTIDGGTGNDTLDGGAGGDSMIGGSGNDTFNVDDGGDTIAEAAGGGTDTVKTTLASYTLGANLENLTFTGAGNFAGTGNTLANAITGGSGNDTLDGGSGNDKLIGGAGADALTGGAGADKFVFTNLSDFASGPTFDTIADFTHAQADKIDLSGVDAIDNSIDGGANGSFTFIGPAAFSGAGAASAGQLHYVINGSGGVNVEGDTNGDGVADFTLVVNAVASLAGSDFVL